LLWNGVNAKFKVVEKNHLFFYTRKNDLLNAQYGISNVQVGCASAFSHTKARGSQADRFFLTTDYADVHRLFFTLF